MKTDSAVVKYFHNQIVDIVNGLNAGGAYKRQVDSYIRQAVEVACDKDETISREYAFEHLTKAQVRECSRLAAKDVVNSAIIIHKEITLGGVDYVETFGEDDNA